MEETVIEDSETAKLRVFTEANREVAILLNHQRTPAQNYDQNVKEAQSKIEQDKEELAEELEKNL